MTEVDLAYAAGIIDGEGSISAAHSTYKRMVYMRVSVQQKYRIIPDWLASTFGGKVYTRASRPNILGDFGESYVWQLDNLSSVRFITLIRPYMRLKVAQANLVIEFGKTHPGSGNKKTDDVILKQLEMAATLSRLNKGEAYVVQSGGEV